MLKLAASMPLEALEKKVGMGGVEKVDPPLLNAVLIFVVQYMKDVIFHNFCKLGKVSHVTS